MRRAALHARALAAALVAGALASPALAQLPAPVRPGAAEPWAPRLAVSSDTILLPPAESLPFVPLLDRRARVVVTVTPAGRPGVVVWRSDTVATPGSVPLWGLRALDGTAVPSGYYVATLTGADSSGDTVRADALLELTALAPDTQPWPRPPGPRELEPETLMVGQTSPWAVFIGAGAGLLPMLIGARELNANRARDPTAALVAGSVTVVGFIAFFTSRRPAFSAQNAWRNEQVRAAWREERAAVQAANAVARENAPYRVRLESGAR